MESSRFSNRESIVKITTPEPRDFDSETTEMEAGKRVYCPLSEEEPSSKKSFLTSKFSPSEVEMMKNEKSRGVKVAFLKFKCIVVFTMMLIALLEFVYICFNAVFSNTQMFNDLVGIIRIFSNGTMNQNVTSNVTLSENLINILQ